MLDNVPKDLTTFVAGTFKDLDGNFSAKRTTLLVFVILVVICVVAGVFFTVNIPEMIWNGLVDLVTWTMAAILGEHAPKTMAAMRGERAERPSNEPDNRATVTFKPKR